MPAISETRAKINSLLEAKQLPKLVLILAPDRTRPERLVKKVLELHKISSDALRSFSAKSFNQEILNALQRDVATPSLFARSRVVLIRACEELNADNKERLLKLLKDLPADVSFILLASSLTKADLLHKFMLKHDAVLALDQLKGQELKRWAKREFEIEGFGKVDPQLLERLCELAEISAVAADGEVIDVLARMIEKLVLYAEPGKLGLAELDELFSAEGLIEEFKLLDFIALGKRAPLDLAYRGLARSGKSPFMLLGMMQRSFFTYFLIQALVEKGVPTAQMRELLGANQWVFSRQLEAARKFPKARLRRILGSLLALDSRLKNLSLKPETIFGQWLQQSVA